MEKMPKNPSDYLNRNMPDHVKKLANEARAALRREAREKYKKENLGK
jgi:hypothetical protein